MKYIQVVSGDFSSCADYCIYDSGYNCSFCERFTNTRYYKNLQREIEYIKLAMKNEPEGVLCGFCGKLNDFADDIGYFYIMSPFDMYGIILKPSCKACYDKYSSTHLRVCGLGDR